MKKILFASSLFILLAILAYIIFFVKDGQNCKASNIQESRQAGLLVAEYSPQSWHSSDNPIFIQEFWIENQCIYEGRKKTERDNYRFNIRLKPNSINANKHLQGRGPDVIGVICMKSLKDGLLHFRPSSVDWVDLVTAKEPLADTLWLYLASGYKGNSPLVDSIMLIRKPD